MRSAGTVQTRAAGRSPTSGRSAPRRPRSRQDGELQCPRRDTRQRPQLDHEGRATRHRAARNDAHGWSGWPWAACVEVAPPARGILALAQLMPFAKSRTASMRSRSRCPTWGFVDQIGSRTRCTAPSIDRDRQLPMTGRRSAQACSATRAASRRRAIRAIFTSTYRRATCSNVPR